MVELLKQPQFQPVDVELQVASIYAGTKGFMDSLPVDQSAISSPDCTPLKSTQKEMLSAILATESSRRTPRKRSWPPSSVQGALRQGPRVGDEGRRRVAAAHAD
jgi:F0F1-type ATP synthase alpha subunit